MNEEEYQESMRKFLEGIRNLDEEESEAVWRFMESLEDAQLTDIEWLLTYSHRAPKRFPKTLTQKPF